MATPKTTTEKDPRLAEQTRLVRAFEANVKITTEDPEEHIFRESLLRRLIAEMPNLNQSLVTRIYEAACSVEFAAPILIDLRKAAHTSIARHFDLRKPRAKA
mgnify:FL=1